MAAVGFLLVETETRECGKEEECAMQLEGEK
jgi:hypothetical protein